MDSTWRWRDLVALSRRRRAVPATRRRIGVSRLHMPDNNLIEQDHRSIKLRLGLMLGLKRFQRASITIAGIELMHRIRKGQFAPEIWNAVLAA